MAAELLLTFAAEGILTKVTSLAAQELTLAWGFKSELKNLGQSLSIIQDFLRGAADQPTQHEDKGVEKWVGKLKDIAHDADDVLDEINYEVLRRKIELQHHMKRKVLSFLSASNPILFRLKMAHKIKNINASLVVLKNDAALIHLIPKKRDATHQGGRPEREQTDSLFEKDEEVIGRVDDVSNIVVSLTNSNNLSVMAIVGIGGLGKTTLAKSVYNQPAIDTYYHKKIWVCVSNTFEVDSILSQMLESLKLRGATPKNRDALLISLREELKEKRYVLILDDVWNEREELKDKWASLVSCLSKLDSAPGSSVIITTRSAEVASITETLPRRELGKLSDDQCWSILKHSALEKDDHIDSYREEIGRAIAEKCGGVPLVAKVLGGAMRYKSAEYWLSIQNSELWELREENDRIMSVLKLSFHNLKSSQLKQCFAYCSMFKEDFEIERDKLIQLWMAQGLLYPSHDESKEMEVIGVECFNILCQNSLFQDATKDEFGIITKCKMHDLVHDLAKEVSKCESFIQGFNHETPEIRHVSQVPTSTLERMPELSIAGLRSLFLNYQIPNTIFPKLRALRVLDLERAYIQELPTSIGKLKHLRYLDVSRTWIKSLPKSIGKLYNLQTLRLQNTNLKKIPQEMKNLINLRHLYFDREVEVPAGILERLTNLQTLYPYFTVGKEMGSGIGELGGLNQLKGQLIIRYLEHIRDGEEAKRALLVQKNLSKLTLKWTDLRPTNSNSDKVLDDLQPHPNLQRLEIEGFMGAKLPSWMMSLQNLKDLQLVCCSNCEGVPTLGHLPNLRHLGIKYMSNLKCLGAEFYVYNDDAAGGTSKQTRMMSLFPALKTLWIRSCSELIEWMEAPMMSNGGKVSVFPCLEELSLEWCRKLRNAPSHFPCLKKLYIDGMGHKMPIKNIVSTPELATLTEVYIYDIKGLTCLPEGMLKKNKNLTSLEITRCDDLTCIAPNVFGCCTSLQSLSIGNCEKVRDLADGLDTLPLLEYLEVRTCPSLELIQITQGMASLRKVEIADCGGLSILPSGLQFCTSLRELELRNCRLLTTISVCGLSSLQGLSVWRCPLLTSIDGLDDCTSLERLEVGNCPLLTSIPIIQGMPSLRKLKIDGCGVLSSLPIGINCCTSLQELRVQDCPLLTSIPIIQGMPSLRVLGIVCTGLSILLSGLRFCTSLENLWIRGGCFPSISLPRGLRTLIITECCELTSISMSSHPESEEEIFPSLLEELCIEGCASLESIIPADLQGFTCLRELEIRNCGKLKYLPTGFHCLTGLKKLIIGGLWEELDSFPDFQLPPNSQLDRLQLYGWPKLKCLPQIQHLTCLRELQIHEFGGLESLPEWLGTLESLEDLRIFECENLKYLPTLKAMQRLTNLKKLYIYGCPFFKERCISNGSEWHKISHISSIVQIRDYCR